MEKQYLFYHTRKGCFSALLGGFFAFVFVLVTAIYFPDYRFMVGLSLFFIAIATIKKSFDIDKQERK